MLGRVFSTGLLPQLFGFAMENCPGVCLREEEESGEHENSIKNGQDPEQPPPSDRSSNDATKDGT